MSAKVKTTTTEDRKSAWPKVTGYDAFFKIPNNEAMESVMTKSKEKFEKFTHEAASNGKEQFEALVESGNIFAEGFKNIINAYVSMAQSTAEKNNQAFRSLLACKTLSELTETQNKVAQESFDDFMSGFTQLSELSVKVATETFGPIGDQFSSTIKKASDVMAA